MPAFAPRVLYALFLWWFSTGVILYLDGLPRRTFGWSMAAASVVLAIAIVYLGRGNSDTSVSGAYAAFSFGLLAWGWQEISFYLGLVTGPRKQRCVEGCSGWKHLFHAIQASLYHEVSILVTAAIVYFVVWPGSNHLGFWTYVVLWWMHQSAKLNVLLGVRNLNEEFLPDHMEFLKSFLTRKPMNLLFPVSVTISTLIAFQLFRRAFSPGASPFEFNGDLFLGAMMALAILEHWFLVLPLPSAALWRWSLKSRSSRPSFDVEIVAGFLGAGKTSHVRGLLAHADASAPTIVLVNDFGVLGIDGSLLEGRGADIVELPNGCICCSLSRDLAGQLKDAIARWSPRRIIIEPSGVADVAALLAVLERPDLAPMVRKRQVSAVIDAARFLGDFERLHGFFSAQARLASLLIVNKIDLVPAAELRVVEATLRELNPSAAIVAALHGLPQAMAHDAPSPATPRAIGHAHANAALDHHHEPALGFTSWSTRLSDRCHPQGLQDLLEAVAQGAYGQIERVKGIARAGAGWVHFDVAGGRSTVAAFAPSKGEEQRVTAIGRTLDAIGLQAAFKACTEQARG